MKLSIVVCTRNRAASLQPTLDSIMSAARTATDTPVDLVIVDNGSSDNTQAVLAAWAAGVADLAVRIAIEPRPGLSRARNAGVALARGDVVAFTDDDCTLTPNYIRDLVRHWHDDGDRAVIRGGRVELGDPRDLPFTIKLDEFPQQLAHPVHPGGFVHGCNMAISRAALTRIGAFDERFGAGARFIAAEDADYLYRAQILDIPVYYVPDMAVRHYHGRRHRADALKLQRGYDIGNGALYAKHLLANGRVVQHFYWTLRNALREPFGGPKFDPALGLSHFGIVKGNLRGFARFLRHRSKQP